MKRDSGHGGSAPLEPPAKKGHDCWGFCVRCSFLESSIMLGALLILSLISFAILEGLLF